MNGYRTNWRAGTPEPKDVQFIKKNGYYLDRERREVKVDEWYQWFGRCIIDVSYYIVSTKSPRAKAFKSKEFKDKATAKKFAEDFKELNENHIVKGPREYIREMKSENEANVFCTGAEMSRQQNHYVRYMQDMCWGGKAK